MYLSTTYWDTITNLASNESYEAKASDSLLSFETNQDNYRVSLATFAHEHTEQFLKLLPRIDPEYQDLLVGYYLLRKKETVLAELHQTPQRTLSEKIRTQGNLMLTQLLLGTEPAPDCIRELVPNDRLARMIEAYLKSRSFTDLGNRFDMSPQAIRRQFRLTVERLNHSPLPKARALGLYLEQLMYRRQRTKLQTESAPVLKDPQELGGFEVNVHSAAFDQLFISDADPAKSYKKRAK